MPVKIRIGGLFRCCVATLESTESAAKPKKGDELKCTYCSNKMKFEDDAWQWAGEYPDQKEQIQ